MKTKGGQDREQAHTFVAKDDWNVIRCQIGLGFDANQKRTAASSDHALARVVLALQSNGKSSFLQDKQTL